MSVDRETKERDHGRVDGGADPDSLWDPAVRVPTHAERARTLVASAKSGTLSTLAVDPAGYPFGSLVTFALRGGHPVFLISSLAEHTKNLAKDPRASLLAWEEGQDDPLARGRLTLVGDARRLDDSADRDEAKEVVLAAHPSAAGYVDYRDFSFWQLDVAAVRYIGGFGRMSWVDRAAWVEAKPDPMVPYAEGIIRHMNDDHADVLVLACRAFTRAKDAIAVRMTGVDRYGFDMSVEMPTGKRPARVAFGLPIASPDEARRAMVAIAKEARAALGK